MPQVSAPVTSVKESSLDIDVQVALIPLGLAAVEDLLQQEVRQLAGTRYARKTADISCRRWGQQPGSVYLADQQLPLQVPRVRDVAQDQGQLDRFDFKLTGMNTATLLLRFHRAPPCSYEHTKSLSRCLRNRGRITSPECR